LTHFASDEGRSTTEVTLGVPVEDAIVTLFTRSTSGEARLRGVLLKNLFGMREVLARGIARLVRGANIDWPLSDVGGLSVGVPMTLSYEDSKYHRCPIENVVATPGTLVFRF
jgi:hypothetical protein